jgi:predicted lipoprotein with Yx(FWY)xxD motif
MRTRNIHARHLIFFLLLALGVVLIWSTASAAADPYGPNVLSQLFLQASTEAPTMAPAPAMAVALQITQNATLGKILTDGQGRTLYLFEKDTKNTSNCYDACATLWPPFLSQGQQPTLGDGVKTELVGTTQRKDGTTQITYNGWPLYYYTPDQTMGDTKGQGVGDVWYTVTPAGDVNEIETGTGTPAPAETASPTSASTTPIAPAPAASATLRLAQNDKLGSFLTDGQGRTLYLFTKDTKNTSNCYDKCAAAWPPLLSQAKPTLGEGINADLIGTTVRKDGTTQLTYNGWPLYYYTPDQNPGDIKGQGVGNVWYVISPDGNAVMTSAAPAATAPAPAPTQAPANPYSSYGSYSR